MRLLLSSVVTAEDLKKKGITNIADALTEVPGVDVRNGQGKTGRLKYPNAWFKPKPTL